MNVIEKFHVSTNDVRYTEYMIKICYSLESNIVAETQSIKQHFLVK